MAEQLTKLCPDRDLQCYFFQPSAVAALSGTSTTGFTVSGCWRQQFDWAVVEWNRDNVFEYPLLRSLPDGDLSGIRLSYQEARTSCIPFDSTLYPTVDWPYLRVWADVDGKETVYQVPLRQYARPLSDYVPATAQFELSGTITGGDYIELTWMDQHFNYQVSTADTLDTAAAALATIITNNQSTGLMTATSSGATICLTYLGMPGSNGNRVGAYATVHGSGTEVWLPNSAVFVGGTTPENWQVTLDFSNLHDLNGAIVPTGNVRKLRWTWAADLRPGPFQRTEFSVTVSNWTVAGSKLQYMIAGPGSRRIEDADPITTYNGTWQQERGNYSGGAIHWTTQTSASVKLTYNHPLDHTLYLGTRYLASGANISIQVDGGPSTTLALALSGEDVLARIPLGSFASGVPHEVTITHLGSAGSAFYFDFLEICIPSNALPEFGSLPTTTLATDWDTEHSQALAPERTAWMINKLGFKGRANHYAGCLWFYELVCQNQQDASVTVTFAGAPEFGRTTSLLLDSTEIDHVNLIGDTAQSIAKCFELLINAGATGVRAESAGALLTIHSRQLGTAGNGLRVQALTNSDQFAAQCSNSVLSGGADGRWTTDLSATPRINRAARDWSRSFFKALDAYGIAVAVSLSMELGNGDDSVSAGIAQRYPNGSAVWLNTPSLQTNFSPQSTAFWQQVYLDMAGVMSSAGVPAFLQFGEVQWWYFCPPADPANGNWTPVASGGMPLYDSYTTATFEAQYNAPMHIFLDPSDDPSGYPIETKFLPGLIGAFTKTIIEAVQEQYADARFEVLYPPDVNHAKLTSIINFPSTAWTPAGLSVLKTENFTYTGNRDLNSALTSVEFPYSLGFRPSQASHLIGIGDYTTPWVKEWNLAVAAGMESVVLFALDQFCLIGYQLPLDGGEARSLYMGG